MQDTAINFIQTINYDAQEFFRKLAAVGFVPGRGLDSTVITKFTGVIEKEDDLLPKEGIYGVKFVAMKLNKTNKVGSFMLVRVPYGVAPLDRIIPMAVTSAISQKLKFPTDGHLRWRTSAPVTNGRLLGYLTHGSQQLIIDPDKFGLDSVATNIQVVLADDVFNINIHTKKGTVYATTVKQEDILTNGVAPSFHIVKKDVTALLTVPFKREMLGYYGTVDGLYFGTQLIDGTKGLHITKLVVDSENPRIFMTLKDGKILALPVDATFLPTTGKIIHIDDRMNEGEELFAGPQVIMDDKTTDALLAIDWVPQDNGYKYEERTIALPQLPRFPSTL